MVRKITSPVTLQCNITVRDILKVRVKFFRPSSATIVEEDPKNYMVWTWLTGIKSLTPTALAHKCLWEVKTQLSQEKNTPDDSLAMVKYAINLA